MMRTRYTTIAVALLVILGVTSAYAQSAEEIVRRADDAMDYQSAYMEARMVNTDRFGAKTVEYRAWAKDENFLMEFTSTAEFGQKILRTEDRIYHFFPDSESIFTKSRGDSIVGLISYDDVTNESNMLDLYDVTLAGREQIAGEPCFVISMQVKRGRRVAYPIQTVWITEEDYTIRRIEAFTRNNQPLKTMEIREVGEFDGVRMAVDILITDEVRTGITSEIFISHVRLNESVPDSMFTRRELTR